MRELWATDLGVVSSDTTKVWNFFLAAIDLEVLVNLSVDGSDSSGLNLIDQTWDHGALEEWDENAGDLSDKATSEFDINIVWIDVDGEFLGVKLWCELVAWSGCLCACVQFNIDGGLVNLNISLTIDRDET